MSEEFNVLTKSKSEETGFDFLVGTLALIFLGTSLLIVGIFLL